MTAIGRTLEDAIARIDSLGQRPDGHKGPGSKSADPRVLLAAKLLLADIHISGVAILPAIFITYNGAVSMEWNDGDAGVKFKSLLLAHPVVAHFTLARDRDDIALDYWHPYIFLQLRGEGWSLPK